MKREKNELLLRVLHTRCSSYSMVSTMNRFRKIELLRVSVCVTKHAIITRSSGLTNSAGPGQSKHGESADRSFALIRSSVRSSVFVRSFVRSFFGSFVRSFRACVPSFVRSFVRSFVYSFVRSLLGSVCLLDRRTDDDCVCPSILASKLAGCHHRLLGRERTSSTQRNVSLG